jgi:hypothetical protein
MRVRVHIGWATVGRPPSVADTCGTVSERGFSKVIQKHLELAGTLARSQRSCFVNNGDTGGVVTPVFETLKTAEEYLKAFVVTDVTDNSTHGNQFSYPSWVSVRR